MADKDNDLDLDDGFDDFEFDDLDTGIDPPKDDRSPVRKLSSSFVAGVTDDMTDKQNLKRRLNDSLPEGYGKAVNLADDVAGEAKDLYNTVTRETASGVRDFKRASEKVLRKHQDKMPRGLSTRLQKLVKTDEIRKELTAEQIQNEEIGNTLATIFDAQNEKEHDEKQKDRAEELVKDKMGEVRHKNTVGQLDAIREANNRMVSYQDNVTARYQRKSLELQYRQFFVSRDLFRVTETSARDSKEALASISKNTSLPEYRKTELMEASGQMMRDRMLAGAQSKIGEHFSGFYSKLRGNLEGAVKQRAKGVGDNLSMAAGQMEMAREAQESGVDIDPMNMAGGMAGGAASGFLMKRLTPHLQQWAKNNSSVMANGSHLSHLLNLPRQANDYARSETDGGPVRRYFEQLFKDIIPQYQLDKTAGDVPLIGADEHVPFTSLTRRSITEIIPGFLSRIHQEIRILRTGDENIGPVSYNLDRGEFTSQDRVKKDVANRLFSDNNLQRSQTTIDNFVDQIDPDYELSDEARKALVKSMVSESAEGRMFRPEKFAESDFYSGDVDESVRNELASLFSERFGVVDGEYARTDENKVRVSKAGNRFNKLATDTADPGDMIRGYLESGQREALDSLGLITRHGSVDKINYDRIWEILQSGVVDNEDPLGGDGGPSAPYNASGFPNAGNPLGGSVGSGGLASSRTNRPTSSSATGGAENTRGMETRLQELTQLYRENSRELLLTVQGIRDQYELEEEPGDGEYDDPIVRAIEENSTRELGEEQLEVLGLILARLEMGVVGMAPGEGGDVAKGLNASVGSYLKRARGLAGTAGKGLMNYYGKLFSGTGSMIGGAQKLAGGAMTRAGDFLGKGKDRLKDVYVKGSYQPALLASKLKAGEYKDQVTGKVITHLEDLKKLKGNVVDLEGNVVMSLQDVAKGIFTNDGKFNLRGGMAFLSKMYGNLFSPVKLLTDGLRGGFKSAKNYVQRIRDVYIKGENKPRLLATVMRNGGYVNKDGKVITSFKDIDGDIYDRDGNLVLSLDDMRKGLTDIKGRSLNFAKRLGQRLKGAAQLPSKALKWGLDKLKGGMDKVKASLQSGKDAFSGLFSKVGESVNAGKLAEVNEKSYDVLVDIRELLKARLPDNKQSPWDTDGDGMRDGSWRSQFANRDAEADAAANDPNVDGQDDKSVADLLFDDMLKNALGRFMPGGGDNGGGGVDIYGDPTGDRGRDRDRNRNRRPRGRFGRIWQGTKNLAGGAKNLAGRALGRLGRTGMGRAALTAGTTLASASGLGGMLASGAGMLGTAAAAVASAPAWLVGGVVVGTAVLGWLAYRHFTKDNMGALTKLRMLQYGIKPDAEDRPAKIAMLEDKLAPYVTESNGEWSVNAADMDVGKLMKDFGVDINDAHHTHQFEAWMVNRFLPIYLSHKSSLHRVAPSMGLKKVDDDLDRGEKRDYVALLKADKADNEAPYQVTMSPFSGGESLSVTMEDINQAFAAIEAEVKEEEDVKSERRASSSILGADMSPDNLKSLGDPQRAREITGTEDRAGNGRSSPSISRARSIQGPVFDSMVDGERVISALDAIRFRVYGLKDMEHRKVAAIRRLETAVLEHIEFDSDNKPEFTGDMDSIYRRAMGQFGLSPNDEVARRRWKAWFRTRFLSAYMVYLSGLRNTNPSLETAKNQLLNKPTEALAIAEQLVALMVSYQDEEISVWEVPSSPWLDYVLNLDPSSVAANLQVLRDGAEERKLAEERGALQGETDGGEAQELSGRRRREQRQQQRSQEDGSQSNSRSPTPPRQSTPRSANRPSGGGQGQAVQVPPPSSSSGHSAARIDKDEGYRTVAAALVDAGITDPEEQAMAMAQLGHESGNFTQLEENLNYSADSLLRVFGKYFPTRAEAAAYARNKEAIANKTYGGRMGNQDPGDGWKYRGRGFIQLTGRDNYERVSVALGEDYVNNPDLLTQPEHAAKASLWWWKNRNGLRPAAQEGDVRSSTRLINGGYNGLSDRQTKFRRYHPLALEGEISRDGMKEAANDPDAAAPSPMEQTAIDGALNVADTSGTTEETNDDTSSTPTSTPSVSSSANLAKVVRATDVGPRSSISVPSIDNTEAIAQNTTRSAEVLFEQRNRQRVQAEARDRQGMESNEEMSRSMTGVEQILNQSLAVQSSIDTRLQELVALIKAKGAEQGEPSSSSPAPEESVQPTRPSASIMEAAVNLARRKAS
jgi:predicted chitinase